MIKWFRKNQDGKSQSQPVTEPLADEAESPVVDETDSALPASASVPELPIENSKQGFYTRLKRSMSKTRQQLGEGIGRLLLGRKEIDASIVEEIETLLISADLGIETSQAILQRLSDSLARNQLANGEAVLNLLKESLQTMLAAHNQPLNTETPDHSPFVILAVGINGAGKTTTVGKLAKQFQLQGKKVMLAAGDTFRAAAVEQLQVWGERNQIPVIAQQTGADSASVIYDALQAAKARGIDILIADTAGRLHTQGNLMEELKKVKRVMQKLDINAPHETMLVLDASIGQNALNQARQFHRDIGLTGITMTKLDGTAKGGILFAIANELDIPFRYIGIGEGIDDLRPFDAVQFVRAIFNDD